MRETTPPPIATVSRQAPHFPPKSGAMEDTARRRCCRWWWANIGFGEP